MSARRSGFAGEFELPTRVWLTRMSDVAPRAIRWLWPGRVPLGKVTLLVGDPGRGKSLLALDMAARVTRGATWPDPASGPAPLGSVVMLNAEDDAADTIRPRFEAAGGDVDRAVILRAIGRPEEEGDLLFSLARDVEVLEGVIRQCKEVRLVVLDPVSAYMAGAAHSNEGLRQVLAPLRGVADRNGVAVVAISHLTKKSETALLYRAMGSMAYVAAARAVWAVGPDRGSTGSPQAQGRMLFLPVKCNLAGGVTGLAYRIVPSPQDAAVPVLAWEPEPVALTAEEGLGISAARPSRCETAAKWLEGLLRRGPLPAQDVERMGLAAGFSMPTLRRARRVVDVVAFHDGATAPWMLRLPDEGAGMGRADEPATKPAAAQ